MLRRMDAISMRNVGQYRLPSYSKKSLEKLDVGFAFDGDADRLIAIDHTGRILDGDYRLAVCAQALLEKPSQHSVRSSAP